MSHPTPAPPARDTRSPLPRTSPPVPATALTVFGCGPDEAALFAEMAPRFGVVPILAEAAISAADLGPAPATRCVSIGHKTRVPDRALRALSRAGVRHIVTRSIGSDHLDLGYAARVGISVSTVSYSPDSVADYTLMLMLMALRDARPMVRRADAHDYRLPDACGRELRDLTVGVVGTGRIGTAVIERLAGFGCRVLTHDRRPDRGAGWVELDDLVRRSDVVTLHVPLTADTRHLLDRRRIGLMKDGAFVVNTARGALLDTEALVDALADGRLGGAALDVLEGEEGVFYADRGSDLAGDTLPARLRELPNAIVSPHAAYYTDRALREIVENTIVDCLAFESGWAA